MVIIDTQEVFSPHFLAGDESGAKKSPSSLAPPPPSYHILRRSPFLDVYEKDMTSSTAQSMQHTMVND